MEHMAQTNTLAHIKGELQFHGMAGPIHFDQNGDNLHNWVAYSIINTTLVPTILFRIKHEDMVLPGDHQAPEWLKLLTWPGGSVDVPRDYAPNNCKPGEYYTRSRGRWRCELCEPGTFSGIDQATK